MAESRPARRFARIDRLPPYVFNITAELKMAARRRGEDIIDLSMGNPDGPTPPHIVEKLCTVAQREDTHGYSTSRGIPRLRRAISHWYRDRYDVQIDPESEAIVTIGSKEGLAHLMLATLDHGDTILVPNPSYPIHIYGAVIAGAQVRSVPLVPGIDFFNELERAIRESIPKPRMMILGFPSNPTAQCVELDFFERVVALGIGVGSGYLFETDFKREVYSDLTGERGTLMGAIQGIFAAQYDTLRAHGHTPSEAFNETVEELTQSLMPLVAENGMDWMYANCSTTAQRGALDWWKRFRDATKPVFEELYGEVAAGNEAQRSIDLNSKPDYREKLNEELREMRESEMWQTGAVVRKLRPENN